MCPYGTMRDTIHPVTPRVLRFPSRIREKLRARGYGIDYRRPLPLDVEIARHGTGSLTNGSQPRDTSGINLHSCLRVRPRKTKARVRQNIPTVKRAWTRAAMFHRGIVGGKKRKEGGQGRTRSINRQLELLVSSWDQETGQRIEAHVLPLRS